MKLVNTNGLAIFGPGISVHLVVIADSRRAGAVRVVGRFLAATWSWVCRRLGPTRPLQTDPAGAVPAGDYWVSGLDDRR